MTEDDFAIRLSRDEALVLSDWLDRDLAQLYGTVRNATDMAEHYDLPKHTA